LAVNIIGWGTAWSTLWVQRELACSVTMLRIRMTGNCVSRGQWA